MITIRVNVKELEALKKAKGKASWHDLLRKGASLADQGHPTFEEVEALIDRKIEQARRGY